MWTLAIKTLVADRGKLLTALVGVVFAVVLVNVQGGLFLGLIAKASLLVDHGEADVWVGHKEMDNVDFPGDIPRRWLYRVRAVPGVAHAEPYLIGHSTMTLPGGGFEPVLLVGSPPEGRLGGAWNLREGAVNSVRRTDGVIVDAHDADKLRDPQVGDRREIGGRRARVVGRSEGILGFLVTPYVFTTLDAAAEYLGKPADVCSYILVAVEPGAEAELVAAEIVRRLPEVDAYPAAVYGRMSVAYWLRRTGLGISFGAATLLGLTVGLVIVAQTLYAMVLDRLGEFGTLKAIGASEGQVYHIVFVQAVTMALAGSLLGLVAVHLVQAAFSTPRAPIAVPWWLSLGSCTLVTAICVLASWLPYQRIRRVDPMMVMS